MDPKDLPDGRAFEDEFTRSLLQSTEEVLSGYFPFLAKNERWEMVFPEEGLVGEKMYITKDNFESIIINDWNATKNTSVMIDIKFYSSLNPGFVESKKNSLQTNMELSLDFEKVRGEGQTYYVAPFEKDLDGQSFTGRYGIAAYIQNENEAGGMHVIYSMYCEEDCEDEKEADLAEAREWLMTIQFLDESKRSYVSTYSKNRTEGASCEQ